MVPMLFLERMQRMLGGEYEAFLEALGQERHQALRLNPLKRRADERSAAEVFGEACVRLQRVPWAEDGYYYGADARPGKHPFHEAGLYYIQEPSAMLPVELLEVEPGDRVLDLCAAPGGKSTQIGAKLKGRGILVCSEIHPARGEALSENIERMGIGNACVMNETPERLAGRFCGYFDRILVDAPCSGEGMFRKNQAACEEWSLENVARCADRQDRILDSAGEMLAPGGRLVYSTCTFSPEENEGSVSRFLRRHEEFELVPVSAFRKEQMGLSGCDGMPEFTGDPVHGLEGTVRLWPHRIRGEGHFAAVLQKAGKLSGRYRDPAAERTQKEDSRKEPEAFREFCRENLQGCTSEAFCGLAGAAGMEGEFCGVWFGEHLYLVSAQMPSLKGLRVLRPGLHLGTLKKNRFEPSHALALAIAPGNAAHVWNLESGSREILSYVNGGTFPAEGEKGWYLICVDGFGIGWGKLAGGMMKNHYPKGLRGRV